MEKNFSYSNNIFERLHKGEQVKCLKCGSGIIRPMSDRAVDKEFCFECDNCKAHYRYDPVVVTVE